MVTIETRPTSELLMLIENSDSHKKLVDQNPALSETVSYIMNVPGKRFRPLLLLQACDLFDESAVLAAINPALAMEVFHNFTLVHDDIMDEADLRRGQPTVHKEFGVNSAIIVGDTLLVHAYQLLAMAPQEHLSEVLEVFSGTALNVMEGQQLDMEFEGRNDVSEADYLHMIENKTSVLLAASLQIGAILGGASQKDHRLMFEFGRNLGLMFQIKDDLLDAFGEESIGKRIGGDIVQNKKTFLHVSCMNLANTDQRKSLANAMDLEDEDLKIDLVKALFIETGARGKAEEKMREFYNASLSSLDQIGVEESRKEQLKELADSIFNRTH